MVVLPAKEKRRKEREKSQPIHRADPCIPCAMCSFESGGVCREEGQDMLPENIPLWYIDYFGLKTLETLQVREELSALPFST